MLLGAKGPTEVHEDVPKAIAIFLGDDVQLININVEEFFLLSHVLFLKKNALSF